MLRGRDEGKIDFSRATKELYSSGEQFTDYLICFVVLRSFSVDGLNSEIRLAKAKKYLAKQKQVSINRLR